MLKKFTWGHGVVLMLGSFIAFILFMIIVFPNGQQNAELVSDDYYADELQYQQVIDAKNNADQLTEKPIYQQNDSGISISCLCPGPTHTPFMEKVGIKFEIPAYKSSFVAKYGIDKMLKGKTVIIPGIKIKILMGIVKLLPKNKKLNQTY